MKFNEVLVADEWIKPHLDKTLRELLEEADTYGSAVFGDLGSEACAGPSWFLGVPDLIQQVLQWQQERSEEDDMEREIETRSTHQQQTITDH